MRPMRDPAPSRLAYRMNRLMLTPRFRVFLRFGLPVLVLAAIGAVWASDEARVQNASDRLAEVRRQIEERPEFMVHMMAVEDASDWIAADVRRRVPLDFPISSFDLDLDAIREDVEKLDAVASASVQIRSGGILSISLVEREPALVWRSDEGLILLDAEGHKVAPIEQRSARPDLPLIAGAGAKDQVPEALEIFAVGAPVVARWRGLVRVGERRWDVVMDRDQRIMLPEANPVAALQKVIALDAAQDLLARDIGLIDFRNPRRPVLRLTDGAIAAMADTNLTETREETQ